MKYLWLVLIMISVGCTSNDVTSLVPLEAKWVEETNRQDTIIFDQQLYSDDRKYFVFKSHNAIAGYNSLYSSIYEFKIQGEKISIYNSISSCYCFDDYFFKQNGERIMIENFYDSNSQGEIETFVRLK